MKTYRAISKTSVLALCILAFGIFGNSNAFANKAPEFDQNKVFFSVNESMSVDNDMVSITFTHIAEGENAQDVADQINRQMGKAFRVLKAYPEVVKKTTQYRVNPIYKKSTISHWRGQQSLTLSMPQSDTVNQVLKKVQPYLAYQSMHFFVSTKIREKMKETLIQKAIKKYQNTAKNIASGFGHQNYKLIETRINTPNNRHQKVYAHAEMRSAAMDMASPNVSAGESQLSVTISGSMLLPN